MQAKTPLTRQEQFVAYYNNVKEKYNEHTAKAKFYLQNRKNVTSSYAPKGRSKNLIHIAGVGYAGKSPSDYFMTDKDPDRSRQIGIEFDDPLADNNRHYEEVMAVGEEEYPDACKFEIANAHNVQKVEYAPKKFLLRVTFVERGTVCIYDTVPPGIFARLQAYAASMGYETSETKSFGAYFWDIMRVHWRGNFVRAGSRYEYSYVSGGPTNPFDIYKRSVERTSIKSEKQKKTPGESKVHTYKPTNTKSGVEGQGKTKERTYKSAYEEINSFIEEQKDAGSKRLHPLILKTKVASINEKYHGMNKMAPLELQEAVTYYKNWDYSQSKKDREKAKE